MDKVYDHTKSENKWYPFWEKSNYFTPNTPAGGDKNKKPFSIILPPPNANAPLHFGHAMYVIEDILIRYHRMCGTPTLWLPGADHAGFETQFVFEKHLASQGKSRFDYNRDILYKMIWDFVAKNRGDMEDQLRRLGFSLDWSREKFTLDSDIIKIVYQTFKKMHDDGLIYRTKRLVNYCTKDGTSFSDLEVVYEERKDPLYYIKYGPLTLATVRPETKFGDTAVAVNPKDKRYEKYIGKEIKIETVLGPAKIKVIADDFVDPDFGTGVVKVTPAHDFDDYEIGIRHNLELKQVIDFDGKLNKQAGKFAGMTVSEAREKVVSALKNKKLLVRVDEDYAHRVGVCYKCKTVIEPLPKEQWFVKMQPLAKPAIEAVKRGKVRIYPKHFEKIYFQFLENIKDWNISRQIVWGIQIPAWHCSECNFWTVTEGQEPNNCQKCNSKKIQQDTDTFDTWFSSSQWPFATLKTTSTNDYDYFYPTTVMETGYDILRMWVCRMVMMGLYATGKIPFKNIVLHGIVKDPFGKKMSKSKGNVINPLEIVEKYGADSVRMALVFGAALGNDQTLSHPKLQAMRNFTNKLWNMGRFIILNFEDKKIPFIEEFKRSKLTMTDQKILKQLDELIKKMTLSIENFRISDAALSIYEFSWHQFADIYIEESKIRIRSGDQITLAVLHYVFITILKLTHPFMPFITEELWHKIPGITEESIVISKWPNPQKAS